MSDLMQKIEHLWGIPIFFTENEKSIPQGFGAFLEEESPFMGVRPNKVYKTKKPVLQLDLENGLFI